MITRSEREKVYSKYKDIKMYDYDDINNVAEFTDGTFVLKGDYEKRIEEIYSDINNILKMLKSCETANAIDEMEILEAKLY